MIKKINQKVKYKQFLKKLEKKIKHKTDLCYVGSDPTRVKILLLLSQEDELCTSGLAEALGVSVSAISHQKAILKRYALIENFRTGKKISCRLSRNVMIGDILKGIV